MRVEFEIVNGSVSLLCHQFTFPTSSLQGLSSGFDRLTRSQLRHVSSGLRGLGDVAASVYWFQKWAAPLNTPKDCTRHSRDPRKRDSKFFKSSHSRCSLPRCLLLPPPCGRVQAMLRNAYFLDTDHMPEPEALNPKPRVYGLGLGKPQPQCKM